MYADFIAMDVPLQFTQDFIDKVQGRMLLAILGKCSIGDTLGPDLHIPTLEEFRKNRPIIEETSGRDQDIQISEGSAAPIPDPTSTVKNVVDKQVPRQGENANNEVSDVDNYSLPDLLSATSTGNFYVTQLKNKLSPGFI